MSWRHSSATVTLMFSRLELHHQVDPPEQNTDRQRGDVVVGVPRHDIQYVCPLLVTTAPDRHSPLCVEGGVWVEVCLGVKERRKMRQKIKIKITIHFYYCLLSGVTLNKTIKPVCLCLLISNSPGISTRKSYIHIMHLIYC